MSKEFKSQWEEKFRREREAIFIWEKPFLPPQPTHMTEENIVAHLKEISPAIQRSKNAILRPVDSIVRILWGVFWNLSFPFVVAATLVLVDVIVQIHPLFGCIVAIVGWYALRRYFNSLKHIGIDRKFKIKGLTILTPFIFDFFAYLVGFYLYILGDIHIGYHNWYM